MTITIPAGITDDNEFINVINFMLPKLCSEHTTERLWVIQIDNWFDHKWLGFSGKGIVDFQFPEFMHRFDAALEEFYQDRLTFPPFAPNRVLSQWSFQRNGDDLIEVPLLKLPHPLERHRSNLNLQRRIKGLDVPSLFVWFSGNTLKNGRASIMVYDLRTQTPVCWFASLTRKAEWSLLMTIGADRKYVSSLLSAV